jgi:hypothetical protein
MEEPQFHEMGPGRLVSGAVTGMTAFRPPPASCI